jgi:serine/threonine protein kinase
MKPDSDNVASEAVDSLVAAVADEFMDRVRRGDRPAVEDYARQHPEIADLLRRVLPALEVLGLPTAPLARPDDATSEPTAADGVLGDFRILRQVGRGGMGIVYEAEQISLGRRVALKVLPFAATMDQRQLQRFQNEARAAASLERPHIVPVYGVGCERGVHYYAMKFIDGQSLAAMIEGHRQASEPYLQSEPRTQRSEQSGAPPHT